VTVHPFNAAKRPRNVGGGECEHGQQHQRHQIEKCLPCLVRFDSSQVVEVRAICLELVRVSLAQFALPKAAGELASPRSLPQHLPFLSKKVREDGAVVSSAPVLLSRKTV
jgi:hypothetical protein